ncbi:hypothetical protein NLJ89_g1850 [Agrocybe chaxingu]|uniref:Uncharacterized protein n=1 Tax=Agrocybe chaxingu TaxID=84603 RepID=A0A9W8TDN8_9AGAR|nr:hypothetical protein NLJ89_g1850 [Agrocybe chaxingu]
METPRKRKRDTEELPRISYDAATRTFDRLFKEDSLEGMKGVVRRKLGVSDDVPVYLSQIREGKSVDLEDDDDFEAFQSAAYSTSVTRVQVVLGGNGPPTRLFEPQTPSRKEGRKRRKSDASLPSTEAHKTDDEDATRHDSFKTPKKRRVSFAESTSESVAKALEMPRKKKEKSKPTEEEMKKKRKEEKTSEEAAERKKRKKEKEKEREKGKEKEKEKEKEVAPLESPTAPSVPLARDNYPPETLTGDPATTTTTNVVDASVEKKSKKRTRSDSTVGKPPASTPTVDNLAKQAGEGAHTQPLKKKSKKKHVEETSESTSSTSPETTPTFSPPLPAATAQSESSMTGSGEKVAKKPRKSKDKAAVETSDAPPRETTQNSPDAQAPQSTPIVSDKAPAVKKTRTSKPKSSTAPAAPVKAKSTKEKATKEKAPAPPKPVEPPAASEESPASQQVEPVPEPKKKNSKKAEEAPKKTHLPPAAVAAASQSGHSIADNDGAFEDPKEPEQPTSTAETTVKRTRRKSMVAEAPPRKDPSQDTTTEGNPSVESPEGVEARKVVTNTITEILARNKGRVTSTSQPPSAAISAGTPDAPRDDTPQSVLKGTGKTKAKSSSTRKSSAKESFSNSAETPSAGYYRDPGKCPICGEEPRHVVSRCLIVKAGIRAMRKRITELEEDDSEDHSEGINLLQTIIERRSKKKTPARTEPANPTVAQENESARAPATHPASGPDDSQSQPTQTRPASGPPAPPIPSNLDPVLFQNRSTSAVPSGRAKAVSAADILFAARAPPSTFLPPLPPAAPTPSPNEPPLTQPSSSIQNTQKSSQKKPRPQPSSQKYAPLPPKTPATKPHPPPADISTTMPNNPLASPFVAIGDLSRFTEKDLEELVKGPRITLKDVPSSDSSDEEEEENENDMEDKEVLLENDDEAPRSPRKLFQGRSLIRRGTSSDEEDSEDEDGSSSNDKAKETKATQSPDKVPEATPASSVEHEGGDLSFQQVNALGSSIEPDLTGNIAVEEALAKDLSVFNLTGPTPSSQHRVTAPEPDSDTAVASQGEEALDKSKSRTKSKRVSVASAPSTEEDSASDPIEPSDEPPATQPEAIASSDKDSSPPTPPVQSTPKVEIMTRTRSQKNKASSQSQNQPTPVARDVDDEPEGTTTRRTRSLMKISALPVPVPPTSSQSSMRVIRLSGPISAESKGKGDDEDDQADDEEEEEEEELQAKKGKGSTKTPAKTKTPTKTLTKAAKTPAKTTAKPAPRTAGKTPAKAYAKPAATPAATIRTRSTRAKPAAQPEVELEFEPAEEPETVETNPPAKTVGFWSVLQESDTSQADVTLPIDELVSSPVKESRVRSIQPELPEEPLFIQSETQQSFPYSQYPDLQANKAIETAPGGSPDDSDDGEVPSVNPLTAMAQKFTRTIYRPLTEIASSQSFFVPRFQAAQFNAKEAEQDLYGRNAREQEDSESETDSESDDGKPPAPPSHIPASRRAGVSPSKRK